MGLLYYFRQEMYSMFLRRNMHSRKSVREIEKKYNLFTKNLLSSQ